MNTLPDHGGKPVIIWLAGVGWDEVRGTDRRLVEELSRRVTVLWCDPPVGAWRLRRPDRVRPVDLPSPDVLRVRVPALPWCTKPGVRSVTEYQTRAAVGRALRLLSAPPQVQVVASPFRRFIPGIVGTRVYYQTDDWYDGASLMGCSPAWVSSNIRANSWDADVVCAVTDVLLNEIMAEQAPTRAAARRVVLANGCPMPDPGAAREREPVAGLVGQLNERLDLSMLEALVDQGVPIRVVGPRADRDQAFGRRLDSILHASGVEYLGAVPAEEVPAHLARLGVGVTPYALTRFNRASFPLKSLEYLAAGLEVVSTALPAVQWLGTEHVSIGHSPAEFAARSVEAIARRAVPGAAQERVAFASRHTWAHRAEEFLGIAGVVTND